MTCRLVFVLPTGMARVVGVSFLFELAFADDVVFCGGARCWF